MCIASAPGNRGRGARGRRDEGATIVETAIVVPVLLVVRFGITEFGFAYDDYGNASRVTWNPGENGNGPLGNNQKSSR